MRQVLLFAVFMLATAVWTMAQQSGANGGQSTSPSSQTPSAGGQGQSSASGSAGGQGSQSPDSAQSSGSAQTQGSSQSGVGSQSQSSQTPSAGGQGQSSTTPGSAGQGSSQTPGQSSTQTPGQGSAHTPGQSSAQSGAATPGDVPSGTVTEGCLGGSNPNFTITDKAGATYKLNFPQNTDVSVLNSHVGESVQVLGQPASGATAGKSSAIDVSRIGRGTGNCQAGSAKPPKQ